MRIREKTHIYIYIQIMPCLYGRDSPCFIPIQPHFFATGTDRNPHVQKLSGRKGVMMVWSTFLFATFTQDSFELQSGRLEGSLRENQHSTGRFSLFKGTSSSKSPVWGETNSVRTWEMMKHVSKQEVWGLSNQCEGFFFPGVLWNKYIMEV